MAHRHRAIRLELRDNVEVDETESAERSTMPLLEGADPLTGVPGRELVQKLVGQPITIVRPCRCVRPGADIQWHVDNLRHTQRSSKPSRGACAPRYPAACHSIRIRKLSTVDRFPLSWRDRGS